MNLHFEKLPILPSMVGRFPTRAERVNDLPKGLGHVKPKFKVDFLCKHMQQTLHDS